ncbi:hypothetical protein AKJ47_01925 [candidate division MSBL1 archaeon SCGC-AAA261G05]|uniref:Uncharacterized protein n=2 Tax=candidate division MSBL1 TaxID=215777 RepID=A0A133VB28_9EURY|nr:hypothetical protein AKJ47_01925 [candidate division MSBL1 archaeon SCGC-AAA261G05]KXB04555.1 hypothetical protein AKJ48_02170 [candidate division MSBL1 archaeon SCGC-AAA261O19]
MNNRGIGLLSIALVGALLVSGVLLSGTSLAQASGITDEADEPAAANESDEDWQCGMNGNRDHARSLEAKLDMLAERFDLTDEEVEEIEEKISTAIEEGTEPTEIREEVMSILEDYGVEIPEDLGPAKRQELRGHRRQNGECEGPFHESTEE